MLYDFITLNIKATQREFGLAFTIALFTFCLIPLISLGSGGITESFFPFTLMAGFAGVMLFFALGEAKLCYKSLLGDCGYLYMTLPVSGWKCVWSKVLAGGFWVFLLEVLAVIGIFIHLNTAYLSGETAIGGFNILLKTMVREGIPAGHMGVICLVSICIMVLEGMLLCAAILLSSLAVHAMRLSQATIPVGILIYAAILGSLFGAFTLQGYLLNRVSPHNLLFAQIGALIVELVLLLLLVYLSKLLLEKRLEI